VSEAPEHVEDARGLLCPLPVIRLADRMRAAARGEIVVLLATDPAAPEDVRLWCRGQGHELLSAAEDSGHLRIRVRRLR
jgi:tRNA 2-thiouridine synthesizing protein A